MWLCRLATKQFAVLFGWGDNDQVLMIIKSEFLAQRACRGDCERTAKAFLAH
jgi:hypothetical protein